MLRSRRRAGDSVVDSKQRGACPLVRQRQLISQRRWRGTRWERRGGGSLTLRKDDVSARACLRGQDEMDLSLVFTNRSTLLRIYSDLDDLDVTLNGLALTNATPREDFTR